MDNVNVCGTWRPPVPAFEADSGVHSHRDPYIHIHPFSGSLGSVRNGDDCAGRPGRLRWAVTGRGGPGYTFPAELDPAGRYPVGTVAMAKSGPDTNGSQFFIVTGDAAADLPPLYTIFGTVTEGMGALRAFETVTREGTEQPVVDLHIFKVLITEAG